MRKLFCWLGWCPHRPASDETGCWGECVHCGKRVGFVDRATLRAYTDREVAREQARRAALEPVPDLVGAAEAQVGRYVYRRIEALMDARPGTPEAAELTYLARVAESVEEYGEEACAGSALANFPAGRAALEQGQ